jgi:sulfite exporter TauE/SafE
MALFLAVFLASLLGSLHCAGMCGAFVAFAVGSGRDGAAGTARTLTAYHLGRLTTYVLLGVAAGALGAAIDLGGEFVGVRRAAAFGAGALMVGFGVILLLRASGVRLPRAPLPPGVQRAVAAGHQFAASKGPIMRATLVGLFTTLLPCGWLYAFAITAAGTADPALGALVMAAFWLGTVPILTGVGVGARALLGPLGARAPALTALALIGVGVFTAMDRMTAIGVEQRVEAITVAHDHDEQGAAVSTSDAIERLKSIDSEEMPCCPLGDKAKK